MADTAPLPTPGGIPLLGNGFEFARDPVDAMEKFASHGDIVRFTFPGHSMYMVTGPSLIEQILVGKQDKFSIGSIQQESFSGIADHAVTMSTGDQWRRLRKAFQPAFNGANIEGFHDRMISETTASLERWDDGEQIDLLGEMRVVTLRILADTLLGIDIRGREDVVTDASDALIDRANFRRLGRFLPDWIPTATDRRFRRAVLALDEFVDECIFERRATESGNDVCSVMLAACDRGELSREEVRHNLVAMLLAGNSSPAVTLTHAWNLLSDHPDVHESLVREYDEVVGEGSEIESVDDLERTRNVISETLRLYPPTTGVSRQATEPVTIGNHRFPEGTQFLLPQWVPHRDERFWDDPTSFDPTRWQGQSDRPDYAYFPFSGGPRYCPGIHFARQEMTLALAAMIGRVEMDVSVDGPLTFTPSMTLRPATTIRATVHRR